MLADNHCLVHHKLDWLSGLAECQDYGHMKALFLYPRIKKEK